VRATVDEPDLKKADVAIPRIPKETLTTEDGERGKMAMAAAIRGRQLDQNSVRAVYKPMRKEIWNRLFREGEEFRFSVNRLLLICDALNLEVDFVVRLLKSR